VTLQYGQVLHYLPDFLLGAGMALWIAFVAFCGGLLIGLFGAAMISYAPRPFRWPVIAYVRFFTYTPQLVQIFFLFFALPEFGVTLSPVVAVLIGMTLNAGAYLTEIERAGFASVPQAELDAAETLGFSRAQTVWYVIAPHVIRALYPLHHHDARHLDGRDLRGGGADRARAERQRDLLPLRRDFFDHGRDLRRADHHRVADPVDAWSRAVPREGESVLSAWDIIVR